jgi:hypothetical protein
MPAEDQPMTGSRPRLRLAFRATMAALAILLLARCSDTVHGSADANGSDRNSVGQVRLGFPF